MSSLLCLYVLTEAEEICVSEGDGNLDTFPMLVGDSDVEVKVRLILSYHHDHLLTRMRCGN